MSGTNAVAPCLALLLTAGAATGQELRDIGPPVLRGACFDPVRQRIVAPGFGNYSRDWDGTAWRQAPDLGSRGTFSGFLTNDRLVTLSERSGGLTWTPAERIGHAWQDLLIVGGPISRWGMTRVHDAARDEILLFGGGDWGQGAFWDETWSWNGLTWSQRSPVHSPSPRACACLAFDANRQRVVLFGGRDTQLLDDTWEWDGTDWTLVPTPNRPSPAWNSPMAHDPVRGRTMLVAPSGGALALWEYDGITWTQRLSPPGTQALPSGTLVFDPARNETLLLGHYDTVSYHSQTWAWNGSTWTLRADLGTVPEFAVDFAVTPSPSGNTVLRFGGQGSSALWEWDGVDWTLLALGGPAPRALASFFSIAGASFLFGGNGIAGPLGDMWRWDGVTWTQLQGGPSPRIAARSTVAVGQGRAVLFGGLASGGPNAETWTFDGFVWQQANVTVQPAPRYAQAMAYDPLRNRVVMFGGQGMSGTLLDTWEWDGTSWTQCFPTTAPARSGSMAFDMGRQRIVHGADPANNGGSLTLFEFDGTNWQPLPAVGDAASPAPIGAYSGLAVTGPSGRVQWIGGENVVELVPTPASATSYGSACGSDAPRLTASCLPRLGEPSFTLELSNCPSNGPVAIAGATTAANVPLLGCTLLLTPGQATVFLSSSTSGFAACSLPIPAATSLLGQQYHFQAAALSLVTANGFALSAGLRCVLGQ